MVELIERVKMEEAFFLLLFKCRTIMDQCPCWVCPVNCGMIMLCFIVYNNVTARCGEFDPCVAILALQ
jgi:hypothetical protein